MKLSEKEIRFIELKSDGLTNMEISRAVYSNTGYVKKMFKLLYRKCDCKNAAQLVKWAIENDYLKINSQK